MVDELHLEENVQIWFICHVTFTVLPIHMCRIKCHTEWECWCMIRRNESTVTVNGLEHLENMVSVSFLSVSSCNKKHNALTRAFETPPSEKATLPGHNKRIWSFSWCKNGPPDTALKGKSRMRFLILLPKENRSEGFSYTHWLRLALRFDCCMADFTQSKYRCGVYVCRKLKQAAVAK